MLQLFSNNREIRINPVQFSDGALTYKVEDFPDDPKYISITVDSKTPVYRVREELELLADSILRLDLYFGDTRLYLNLPYLPYGRADRKFENGNPLPLLNFLSWLRDEFIEFDEIHICDIHNPEFVLEEFAELPIVHKTQLNCFKDSLPSKFSTKYDIVLAPDKGSVEKAATIAAYLKIPVYNCGKERDISTGKITKSTLPEGLDLSGKTILIPDDLCDGNYTFYSLSKLLKENGAKQVDLYVTHMIGSKGFDNLKGLIDNIYCHHIVGNYVNKEDVWRFNEC